MRVEHAKSDARKHTDEKETFALHVSNMGAEAELSKEY